MFFKIFYFSFQREISKMCRPIGTKFCTAIRPRPNFITRVQNFGQALPEKILGAKKMQNLVWFRTTSKFDGNRMDKFIQNRAII